MDIAFQLLKEYPDNEPMRGDDIQDKLMENLVGIREPRSRRKLRSMGAPIKDVNQSRGEAGGTKLFKPRAKKVRGKDKGTIMQDAIMGKDVPKLTAQYPTWNEEDRPYMEAGEGKIYGVKKPRGESERIYDIDNLLHTIDNLSERGEYDAVEDLLDGIPEGIRMERAMRYHEALDKTPWLHNRNIMMEGGNDENTDVVDEYGVPHHFPFTGNMNQIDETLMQRLEDVESLTGTDSLRIPTPRHHEVQPYFRRDRSGKYILPPQGLSTSGDDKETPRHRTAWQHTDMPRPIWMRTIGGDEEPSSKFVEVHPGQEGKEWPHWSDFNQSQDVESMQEDNVWGDQSLGFDETGKGNLFRPKQDLNNPVYRAREERGEPLMPLPRKLTLKPNDEQFEAAFGSDGQGVFTGLPFNMGTGFTTGEPMKIAFQLLKEIVLKDLDRPDDWPPNYFQSGDVDADLEQREIDHVKSHSNEKFTPEPVETVPMPDGFFRTHAHERLTDRERTVNEDEEKEVRERITQAMQPYVDRMGNYNLGAPKNIAIRTHLLNGHRQPDEANAKSNGDSIVGVVRDWRRRCCAARSYHTRLSHSRLLTSESIRW